MFQLYSIADISALQGLYYISFGISGGFVELSLPSGNPAKVSTDNLLIRQIPTVDLFALNLFGNYLECCTKKYSMAKD